MGLDGVEIFTNSSGSHHELRKLYTRVELIKEATLKAGQSPLRYNHNNDETCYYSSVACIYMPINRAATETGCTMMAAL